MPDEATSQEQPHNHLLKSYTDLVTSYLLGLVRLLEAENVTLKTQLAISRLNTEGVLDAPIGPPYAEVLDPLRRVRYRQFDAFAYVTELSYLVYSTTLLDSFLSDTTRFLFLLHPGSMGKDLSIRLDSIIAASSREELLNVAATKKVRELSYLPFLGRTEFLKSTFGLRIQLDAPTVEALEHYSTLRNVVVHDQSVFDIALVAGGSVTVVQKTCPRHPTPLRSDDLQRAETAHKAVVRAVFEAVVAQVLKGDAATELAAIWVGLGGRAGVEKKATEHSVVSSEHADYAGPAGSPDA